MILVIIGLVGCVSGFSEPTKTNSSYEVLEPETWVGKKLPILDFLDVGKQLEKGNWVVLFYHYDCPDCVTAIAKYEQMAKDLAGNEDFLGIALIEVPPYDNRLLSNHSLCTLGQLSNTKEWFISTPVVALLAEGQVAMVFEDRIPDIDTILQKIIVADKCDDQHVNVTGSTSGVNKPAMITSSYEVLEPKKWMSSQLPLLEYIDIGETLAEGKWIVLFYNHDCKGCREEIKRYEDSAKSLIGVPNVPRIAFVEMPPYAKPGESFLSSKTPCSVGRLSDAKKWFVQTPQIITINDGQVTKVRQGRTATSSLALSQKPLVEVSPVEVDFGKIARDSSVKDNLIIKNISEKPVFLSSKTGCGCTKAILKSESLLPQQSTELQIYFEPGGKKKKSLGKAKERIALTSSNGSEKYTTVITILAEIVVPSKETGNSGRKEVQDDIDSKL